MCEQLMHSPEVELGEILGKHSKKKCGFFPHLLDPHPPKVCKFLEILQLKRVKNSQKKTPKKHPFFYTFKKVWIWPRPPPPSVERLHLLSWSKWSTTLRHTHRYQKYRIFGVRWYGIFGIRRYV